ncbi:MAG: outer membrane beta-barrel protein [Pseudomonadota bacterium]
MVRRFLWGLMALTVFSGFSATAAISADDFSDFPDTPVIERFDDAFREAGFYAGARAGAVLADDTRFAITGLSIVENAYETGLTGSLFLGFEVPDLYWGIGARVEAEVGYSQLDVDTHTVAGTPVVAASSFGSTDALTAMANLYLDYSIGAFRPFVGGGIGVARVGFDNHGVTGNLGIMDDTKNRLAWQVMAGVGFDVTSDLTIEAMVRYQEISDVELISSTGTISTLDLASTHILLGARYSF